MSRSRSLPLLLLAAITLAFATGCEVLRCNTCPDARNETPPPQHQA